MGGLCIIHTSKYNLIVRNSLFVTADISIELRMSSLLNRVTFMKTAFLAIFTLILLSSFSASIRAEIIDNGPFTTDTETGLDWLDVTASVDKSYNYVSNQFGLGGQYEGYRYATAKEFNALVSHYTDVKVTQTQVRQVIEASAKADTLIKMLGSTQKTAKRVRGLDTHQQYADDKWARMIDSVMGITINGQSKSGYIYISYSLIAKTQDFGTRIWHYSNADINRYINRSKEDPEVGSFLVRKTKFSRSDR